MITVRGLVFWWSVLLGMVLESGRLQAALVIQAAGRDYAAFEAEGADGFSDSGGAKWRVVSDPGASGGMAILGTADSLVVPSGVASFRIRFAVPGKYVLYSRWKADEEFAAENPFGANSFFYPKTLGTSPVWVRSLANERVVPESLSYDWTEENVEYEVTEADVTAGTEFPFKTGTREAGLLLDRLVLKQGRGVGEAVLEALPNSPNESQVPQVTGAMASDDLRSVRLEFSRPLAGISRTNFSIGGLSILGAEVDGVNGRVVTIRTSDQAPGLEYPIQFRSVVGADGTPVNPKESAVFRAAIFSPGWVRARLLQNGTEVVRYVDRFEYSGQGTPGGELEMSTIFRPAISGRHAVFVRNSDRAEVTLQVLGAEATLISVVGTPSAERGETNALFVTGVLTAGSNYVIRATLTNEARDFSFWLAAKPSGESGEPGVLSGAKTGLFLNPEAAALKIVTQPSGGAFQGGAKAALRVVMDSARGPIYVQWRRNGEDIPGATDAVYETGALNGANSGDEYRAVVSAAGQILVSEAAVVTVSPGALRVRRADAGVTIGWGEGAIGATLETTASLRPGEWTAVSAAAPITVAGEVTLSGVGMEFFRLKR